MERIELLLRMAEHPELYSEKEWDDILNDEESRKIYQTLVKLDNAYTVCKPASDSRLLEREWERTLEKARMKRQQAAANAEPTVRRRRLSSLSGKAAAACLAVVLLSGISAAAIYYRAHPSDGHRELPVSKEQNSRNQQQEHPIAVPADTLQTRQESVCFEDETLETILLTIAEKHGLEVSFDNEAARRMRLYYEWEENNRIDEVIGQLNTFENIHISLQENILHVH